MLNISFNTINRRM